MRTIRFCLLALLVAAAPGFAREAVRDRAHPAVPARLSGSWQLQVMDQARKTRATLTVSFTDQAAYSCLGGGNWRRVAVSARRMEDGHFFPADKPLAYTLDGDRLTIGRVEVCDGYLLLNGKLDAKGVGGTYSTLGLGGGQLLGYFTAQRQAKP